MTAAAVLAAKLWPALRKLLIRVGRWVLNRVRARGAQAMALYMRIRAEDVFQRRLDRAKKRKWKRRQKWLSGRISRWLLISTWLEKNAKKINEKVADALEKLAIGDRIPVASPWERRAA